MRYRVIKFINFLQHLESLVGKHSVGLLVGSNLFFDRLILFVGGGRVEFAVQILNTRFARFQLQLFVIRCHPGSLNPLFGLAQFVLAMIDAILAGCDLLGTSFQARFQIGFLLKNAMKRAKSIERVSHDRRKSLSNFSRRVGGSRWKPPFSNSHPELCELTSTMGRLGFHLA